MLRVFHTPLVFLPASGQELPPKRRSASRQETQALMRWPFLVTNPTNEQIMSMYIPRRHGLSRRISACLVFQSPVASSALPREAREKGTPLDRTTVGGSHPILPPLRVREAAPR